MPVDKQKSKNVSKNDADRVDQRVARTRDHLDTAFVAMLHRRAYDGIRVGDIARKAGVGRATFYAHYATKHDLLQSQLRRIVGPMIVATGDPACPLDATALFAHLSASPRIYQGLMAGGSGPLVQQMLLACFEERLQQFAPTQAEQDVADVIVPCGLADRFIASSLLTLVSWCVEMQTTQAPKETQEIYAALIGGARARA
jgi:AcrR family transcriptional regulator